MVPVDTCFNVADDLVLATFDLYMVRLSLEVGMLVVTEDSTVQNCLFLGLLVFEGIFSVKGSSNLCCFIQTFTFW